MALVSLSDTSKAQYSGKKLTCEVYVSGKSSTPYIIPKTIEFDCSNSSKECQVCSLANTRSAMLNIGASSRNILALLGKSDKTVSNVLRAWVGACEVCEMDIIATQNIEELRVSPNLDAFLPSAEYVTREVYYLGHGLQPNRPYRLQCYCYPEPATQRAVLVADQATPLRDAIENYDFSKVADSLKIFQGEPEDVFKRIYEDFTFNVHRIVGRYSLQVAIDLVFHSVLQFKFQGVMLRRGWTEGFVLGDSGQGKTELTLCLLNHYKQGDRIQGEGSSTAGLIGGLEKLGDRWILVWGRIPQLDRRLLIIDEFSGVSEEDVAKLSDIRSTGIAEITKIRTERASARTRLIMMSNTRDGEPLSAYNTGVEALKEVFGHAEDVRRLDFALCVASGEVSPETLNASRTPVPHTFTSDLCRDLILWVWSRTPEQVIIDPTVEKLILERASQLADRYSAFIPLVEPADTRVKLARLSVACACRCFSADAKGNVIVKPSHVDFIYNFLRKCYDSSFMGYDTYSVRNRAETNFEDDAEIKAALHEFCRLAGWKDARDVLTRVGNPFRGYELAEQLGIESYEVKEMIHFFSRYKMIQTLPAGYRKLPKLNVFLRSLNDKAEETPNDTEPAFKVKPHNKSGAIPDGFRKTGDVQGKEKKN